MNKPLLGLIIIILAIALFIISMRRLRGGPEDTRLCKDGQRIMHGNPSSPMPTDSCK
ncbi:MAG: hypothetical protein WAZ12_02845 [Candidatus Absconditicoccaceae bacterium]